MFNACKINSNCCREESDKTKKCMIEENQVLYDEQLIEDNGGLKKIIEGEPDQSKAVEISQHTEREYVAITAYQPVDIVTRTVEVPFVRTIETTVPKITYESKIREVPKYYSKIIEKVIEIPEVKYVDKIIDVPRIQYCYKYVPKVEFKENIIKKPVFEKKIVEKIVEVPKVKEMKRFQEVETVEYVIKYVPKSTNEYENEQREKKVHNRNEDLDREMKESKEEHKEDNAQNVENLQNLHNVENMASYDLYSPKDKTDGAKLIRTIPTDLNENFYIHPKVLLNEKNMSTGIQEMYPYIFTRSLQNGEEKKQDTTMPSFGLRNELSMMQLQEKNNSILHTPRIEQVFKPKIVKNIEVQKHVPISVDVPVPYMVPKPVVVNVEVPVLKFRDTFVPVPVRRKIIPKIKWISDVYQVDCIKERPYLKIQDIIKPIPCDVDIKYWKYMEKACAINPNELPQDDVHAMWMRVNAHLAEKKKKEYGDLYPYYRNENGEINFSKEKQDGSDSEGYSEEGGESAKEEFNENYEGERGAEENKELEKENEHVEEDERNEEKAEEDENNYIVSEEEGNDRGDEDISNKNKMEENIYRENIQIVRNGNNNIGQNDTKCSGEQKKQNGQGSQNEEAQIEYKETNSERGKVNSEKNIFLNNKNNETLYTQNEDKSTNVCCQNTKCYDNSAQNNEEKCNFECMDEFINEMKKRENLEEQPIASLYPSHPLAMTYLQNKWIHADTLRTHELYNDNFIKANINANFNLQSGNAVVSDIMRNKDFLQSANPIIAPFRPGNMRHIENYYNNVIIQNIREENNKFPNNRYIQMTQEKDDIRIQMNENMKSYSKGEKSDSEDNQCCNYFCKN
ncbi:inner membrane complex protein 1a, putative [Plasmodium malariae]|uniref:Inner membrane complex protein 1a, putative n=1 Tax=Plasmodium malariae TaxID=5858 RepID=A0A1C3KYW5_PLAMA|nr:inner membrane complex protein 1a, putative [Plasmodium malariae]